MQNNIIELIFPRYQNASLVASCNHPPQHTGAIASQDGGFEVAGFCPNGHYRILSRKSGRMVDLAPTQLGKATLFAQLGMSYCMKNYSTQHPKTGRAIFDLDLLINSIRQGCDDFGPANLEAVRGPGLYLDEAQLVVNYGNAVYDHDGLPISTKPTNTRAYVQGEGLGFTWETPCASQADVDLVEQAFESFAFEQPWGAAASLGWFASSTLGAVLPNSPSVILTATKGSGKSTWVSLQTTLLGPQAILRDGVPSVPQVLHAVSEKSVTLICDEFEPLKRTKSQMENLAEVFNSGFTKSPGKAKFTRVMGGTLKYFNPPAGVALCGINVPDLDDALESRSVRLSMVHKIRTGESKSALLGSDNHESVQYLGARLRRLLISRWQVIRDTRLSIHKMLQDIGHTDRFADTHSPLVAGYVGLKHETVPDAPTLQSLLHQWELDAVKPDTQDLPSEACLNTLLDRKAVFHIVVAEAFEKTHLRLRDAIRIVVSLQRDPEPLRNLERQLGGLGVRPMLDASTGAWRLAVASSRDHVGIRQIFTGSAWARGGWKDTLLRLPSAVNGQARLAGDSVKVVWVVLPDSVANPLP